MGFFKNTSALGPIDPEVTAEWALTIAAWSPEERAQKEKALVRHIDRRLLPMLVRIQEHFPQESHMLNTTDRYVHFELHRQECASPGTHSGTRGRHWIEGRGVQHSVECSLRRLHLGTNS